MISYLPLLLRKTFSVALKAARAESKEPSSGAVLVVHDPSPHDLDRLELEA